MDTSITTISVVSYINSIPFVYGLEKLNQQGIIISKDIPSECATKLIDGRVDIGLIPVAMISKVPNAEIISNYCIAADGPVASVLIVSNSPMDEINTIYQDSHSRTSVALAKLLMRDYWKKEVVWENEQINFLDIQLTEAIVIIGDRALEHRHRFKYNYDLSEYWKKHSGLPFVFACWVANKKIDHHIIERLNHSFETGINSLDEYCDEIETKNEITGREYLTNFIKHELTEDAKKGLALFLEQLPSL